MRGFDPRLAEVLEGADAPLELLQFPNGSANLTYLLRVGSQELVLRRPPMGQLAPGAHDMRREYKVLSRLWRHFDRAPRAYVFCDVPAVLGVDFFVMERRRGDVVRTAIPPPMQRHREVGRRIGLALVDAMADLHRLDPAACDLGDLGRPAGFVERQIEGWSKRWHLARFDDSPAAVEALHARLARHVPGLSRASIVHNDLKLDNCQFDPADPDRVVSIFDWDMTTLGDPLVDLGTLLNYWPDPGDPEDAQRTSHPGLAGMGLPTRAEVVAHYARRAGADVASRLVVGGLRALEDRRGRPAAASPLGARREYRSTHGAHRRPDAGPDRGGHGRAGRGRRIAGAFALRPYAAGL